MAEGQSTGDVEVALRRMAADEQLFRSEMIIAPPAHAGDFNKFVWHPLFKIAHEQVCAGKHVLFLTKTVGEAASIICDIDFIYSSGTSPVTRKNVPRTLFHRSGGTISAHPYDRIDVRSLKNPRFIWAINIPADETCVEVFESFATVYGTMVRALSINVFRPFNQSS